MPSDNRICDSPSRDLFDVNQWERLAASLHLSPRELDIAQGVFLDHTNAAIAQQLNISHHTVHTHLVRLYNKLKVRSRVELVVRIFAEYLVLSSSADPAGRHVSRVD